MTSLTASSADFQWSESVARHRVPDSTESMRLLDPSAISTYNYLLGGASSPATSPSTPPTRTPTQRRRPHEVTAPTSSTAPGHEGPGQLVAGCRREPNSALERHPGHATYPNGYTITEVGMPQSGPTTQ